MSARSLAIALVWFACLVLGACAGDGTGLDEFGNPLNERGSKLLLPTLASIQENIFTPICTQCHAGASAPLGLSLQVGQSFGALVNVASVELPELMRVRGGEPDLSYLVLKIEGAPAIVGARMPLGQAPLSNQQIAAIRQWITDGAPRD